MVGKIAVIIITYLGITQAIRSDFKPQQPEFASTLIQRIMAKRDGGNTHNPYLDVAIIPVANSQKSNEPVIDFDDDVQER